MTILVWRQSGTVASIQIYFEGVKFFPSQGGGRSFGPMAEARRVEIGGEVLGEGQPAPSTQGRGSRGAL